MKEKLRSLREIQRDMFLKVVVQDGFKTPVTHVSGIGVAFIKDEAIVACVTMSFPYLEVIETIIQSSVLDFPYVPTFLGFREGPVMVKIINSLKIESDVFLINAHGIAHPLFFGCASHVGVLTQKPTVGVATNNLCGEYESEYLEVGEAALMHYGGNVVGWVLRSKQGCRLIFISPGHLIGLESSLKIVRECLKNHKLPEPLQYARGLANEERNKRLSRQKT